MYKRQVLKLSTTKAANESNGTTGNYVAFDVFFKTETAGQIYLTTSASVTKDATSEEKGLKNASRIAFVNEGNKPACLLYTSEKYNINAVNYNRDVETFPILKNILHHITGKDIYFSPTDMGVNMVGYCIKNNDIVENAVSYTHLDVYKRQV